MVRNGNTQENPTPDKSEKEKNLGTVETENGVVEVTPEMLVSGENSDGLSEENLREIENFDDIKTLSGVAEITSISAVLGTGFSVLEDKARLLNLGFIIVKFGTHESEKNGGEFSTLHVVTDTKEKWIVNDGSTGIHAQMTELKEKLGSVCPLFVPRGLRVSEYDYENDKGETSRARTYYLNTSK
jgi:hypothetical protein